MTRVYVPATMTLLARWHDGGEVVPQGPAHAVTPALREWYVGGDAEELEYAALLEAAQGSLHRLAADPDAVARRVVLAADVDDRVASPAPGVRSAVTVAPLPMSAVVSVHVDEPEAQDDVAAAVRALPAAAAGDDDAQFVVDSADAHDLLWFDVREIPDLLG